MYDVFGSKFAHDIFLQKYSMNGQENWEQTCKRVVEAVCSNLIDNESKQIIFNFMYERKFIPGGRYLYSSGRDFHQVNNCFLFRAEDSREGWADLMQKSTAALMTGGGIGVDYSSLREEGAPIKKNGGKSTGPLSLLHMVNEAGRHIMQGGQRRSAIYGSLNWKHPDVYKFMDCKNHSPELRAIKEKDFNFPLPMELTNISVNYDTEFFIAIEDENHQLHKKAKEIWLYNCKQAFSKAEPGMSFNFLKDTETLRNACVPGDTEILTDNGYVKIEDVVDTKTTIWNGFEWSEVVPRVTGKDQAMVTVKLSDGRELTCTEYHDFHIASGYTGKSEKIKAVNLKSGMKLIKHTFPIIEHGPELEDSYTQGFVSAEGMELNRTLYVYKPKEMCISRLEGIKSNKWEEGSQRFNITLNKIPVSKKLVPIHYNLKSKIEWLSGLFDGDGTELKEGGLQLVSVDRIFLKNVQTLLSTVGIQAKVLFANKEGMRNMPDHRGGTKEYFCQETYRICIGAVQMQQLKKLGLKCERMSFTKEPQRDASQFVTVVDVTSSGTSETVYCFTEPKRNFGIFNGILTGQCCEVTSSDDSDKCNLGTVWMNRCEDRKEFSKVVKYATLFLLCGGIYSDVPTDKIKEVGLKNNRIGLGLGGMHEWLMMRGLKYEVNPELHKWLNVYEQESNAAAHIYARQLGVTTPKGIRAIAPTGTIGIMAETTTGIEPLFCKAYKRRYYKEGKWLHQFVVDGSVKRLLEKGVKIEDIQDSYDLSFKDRVKFQADVQNYVDMAISSTCNMPEWGSEKNNELLVDENANILLKYAKRMRGFTCYPDGCRGGQPLTRVDLKEALEQEGQVFEENMTECIGGVCGV